MKKILPGILIVLLIIGGGLAAIFYANGYRFSTNGTGNVKFVEGTGLLVATSKPDGARVLVNDHLTTATNNTINLAPGTYDVKIEKDGYVPWEKKIIIKRSLVSEANALLIPTAPKLEAATTIGISNKITMDPTQTLLAYTVASNSAAKNGIYALDMNARPLIFLSDTGTQLVSDNTDQFSLAQLTFSPNGKQIMAQLPSGTYYLLDARSANQTPRDITNSLFVIRNDWNQQQIQRDKKILGSMPRNLVPVAKQFFKNPIQSPDADKILYTASASGTLKRVIQPQAPSTNSTPDQRKVAEGTVYVYDIKEDKNYKIGPSTNNYYWHADDRHLAFADNGKVNLIEFDAGNLTTVYDGPFYDSLVFPWPDGSSLAILSRLSQGVPYNLYRIGLQ